MLKRLEMLGFKSFADKTEFDFSQGITAIVGPNGSGKSNIVDAVRWVLGEQSPRSLRGGEMTDVIFNGSATRKSLGMAEVSLIFDNSKKLFPMDADEIQVGRRVYANADAEYLINRQVCRLKDIKDLFMGSGAGADAYCIIEQGKVDSLLQSSPKDRRIIFEEASGISRFKSRKVESLRRLERVNQNLERLKDILDEVEGRLKTVRLQATKAQKWKEYSDRLKDLRLALGLQEYSQLTENLDAEHVKLTELKAGLEQSLSATGALEQAIQELETRGTSLNTEIHQQEQSIALARERIAAGEASLRHGRSRGASLDLEILQAVKTVQEQETRLAALMEQFHIVRDAAARLDLARQEHQARVSTLEEEESLAQDQEKTLRGKLAAEKVAHLDSMRNLARMQNAITAARASVDTLAREMGKLKQKSDQAVSHLAMIDSNLSELAVADEVLQIRLAAAKTILSDLGKEREELEGEKDRLAGVLADLQAGRSGVVTRIEVLQGLEKNLEGLGAGPKEALALGMGENPGPWQSLVGMAASLLEVSSEYASLIDLALGDRAQRLVAKNPEVIAALLAAGETKLSGRISLQGFLYQSEASEPLPDLSPFQGIAGWAWELARCSHPDYPHLSKMLLRDTLVVRDQSVAREIALAFPRLRLVTLQGDILEPDGTFTTGPHHAEGGFLSRKAELKDLQLSLLRLEDSLAQVSLEQQGVKTRVRENESRLEGQRRDIEVLSEQLTDLRGRIGMQKQKREGLDEELKLSGRELQGIQEILQKEEEDLKTALVQGQGLEKTCQDYVQEVARMEALALELEITRATLAATLTQAKVALAQMSERADAAGLRHSDIQAEVTSRHEEVGQARGVLQEGKGKHEDISLAILNTTSETALWHLRKESADKKLKELAAERSAAFLEKEEIALRVHADRAHWRSRQELVHGRELAVNDLQVRRDSLCERMRDDYQIHLGDLYAKEQSGEDKDPSMLLDGLVVSEEIAELKKKIHRLGSVNLESLEELAALETRHSGLKIQYDDLIAARKTLEEILARINNDSKTMFMETLGNVRGHFQDLFRKLFGGGMADILLEDDQDVLECGIEIKARPPGKELRSISLMSGGEKTLTAVALLLAIFRNKPSPFCLLDEVDAALDEANISRFTEVLREFLDRSQFILITHSKRTMAYADVLYGITMQESGISRRMSIRFQDWPAEEKKQDEPAA
ncbi:MAG: chromosome segregation protein SMC [Gemmataceae bacterium]|nr:chromosome segregation protein SMC [Gemmataceae bacterium]